MRKSILLAVIIGSVFSLVTAGSWAQEIKSDEFSSELDSFVRGVPKRDADDMPGSVGIIQTEAKYNYGFKVFGKLPVGVGVIKEYIGIENSTELDLPAHLNRAAFPLKTTVPFFNLKDTYFRVMLVPSFLGDEWNFSSSDFRLFQRYFAIYKPRDSLVFILGVAVYPDYESKVLPIVGVIYSPSEKLKFTLIPDRPNVIYALNKKVSLFIEADIARSEYEVTKDNLKSAVLQYREIHLGSGIKYSFNKNISASISAGTMFNRRLQYRDSLGKVNIKDGPYAEFRVQAAW